MSGGAAFVLICDISGRARVLRFDAFIGLLLNILVRGLLRHRWGAKRGRSRHKKNSCQISHVLPPMIA
jgi:hypothetical protein